MAIAFCSVEEEVARAQQLCKVLERCTIRARGGEESSREKKAAVDQGVSELKEAYSQLQQSHATLQLEANRLRQEVATLRRQLAAAGEDHEPVMGGAGAARERGNVGVKDNTAVPDKTDECDPLIMDSHSQALLLVFHALPVMDRCRVGVVCHQWRAVSYHRSLWQHVILSDTSVTTQDMKQLALRCQYTESITLNSVIPSPAECDEDLHSYINRQRGALECGLSVLLHACASSLLSLSITNCSLLLTERSLWLASSLCPQLLHLHYTSEEFPPTPASIWCLASGCPHLLTLSLPPSLHSEMVERFTDACLQQISLGFPHLQCVRLGGSAISVNGLREIITSISSLTHLEVVSGPQLNKEAVGRLCCNVSTSLQYFTLTHTQISPQAVLLLTESWPSLQRINLTISFTDYFPSPNSAADTRHIHKYQRIVNNLTLLSSHPAVGTVFHLTCV